MASKLKIYKIKNEDYKWLKDHPTEKRELPANSGVFYSWDVVDGAISIKKALNVTYDNNVLLSNIEGNSGEISLIKQTAESLIARIQNAESDITDLTLTAEGLSVDVENAKGNITSLQTTAEGLSIDVANAQGDITTLSTKTGELESTVSSHTGDISRISQKADTLEVNLTNAQGDITSLQTTTQGLTTTVNSHTGDISTLNQKAESIEATVTSQGGDIAALTLSTGQIASTVESHTGSISTLTQTAESLTSTVETQSGDISQIQQDAAALSTEVANAKGDITTLQQTASQISADLQTAEGDIDALELTAQGLTNTVSSHTGAISQIQQDASALTITVNNNSNAIGSLQVRADGFDTKFTTDEGKISSLEQDVGSIKLTVGDSSSGLVKDFNDLNYWKTNTAADKDFVNSSIASSTGTFQGTFDNIADLPTTGLSPNDYAFINGNESGTSYYDRYKYNGTQWIFEYRLNNSSFTAAQWAAINSGISNGDVVDFRADHTSLATLTTEVDDISLTVGQIDEQVVQLDDDVNNTTTGIKKQLADFDVRAGGIESTVSDLTLTTDGLGTRLSTAESQISQHSTDIAAKVDVTGGGETNGFGWKLDASGFKLESTVEGESGASTYKEVFKVGRDGETHIGGNLYIEGYVRTEDAVANVLVYYGLSDSSSVEPTSWSASTPAWTPGKYIWQLTEKEYDDGHVVRSQAVCIQGAKGDTGTAPHIGSNGNWYIGDTDTGVKAAGTDGQPGANAPKITSVVDYYYLSTSSSTPTGGSWSSTPAEYVEGRYYFTKTITYYDNSTQTETTPVLHNGLNGSYALAQGKSTTIYSASTPTGVKTGDCWFDSVNKTLKQWDGSNWQDIGNEIVTNKVTANYINAFDITAKKIDIINGGKHLFTADGTASSPNVKIAGFDVKDKDITSGTANTNNYVSISPTTGIKLGKNFSVGIDGSVVASDITLTGYATDDDLAAVENEIPTSVSDLDDASDYAKTTDIPTDISDLNNDVGYQTASNVGDLIDARGYDSSIETAATAAENAQSTANNAITNAATAQTTADNAATAASNAQTSANTAKTTADNAATAASNAVTTANAASGVANSAHTLAQGKNKTTYDNVSPQDPSKGDCWFDTSNGNDALNQWDGNAWINIGGRSIAKVVTAEYIQAKDITARKVDVINDTGHLFIADGSVENPYVKMGGFQVERNLLHSGYGSSYVGLRGKYPNSNVPTAPICILNAQNMDLKDWQCDWDDDGDWKPSTDSEVTVSDNPHGYKLKYLENWIVYKFGFNFNIQYSQIQGYDCICFNYYVPRSLDVFTVCLENSQTGMFATYDVLGPYECNEYCNIQIPIWDSEKVSGSIEGWVVNYEGHQYTISEIMEELGLSGDDAAELLAMFDTFGVILRYDGDARESYFYINAVTIQKRNLDSDQGASDYYINSEDFDVADPEYETGNEFISIFAGSSNDSSAPFRVTNRGKLTATQADITGKITTNSGNIGGWEITSSKLYKGTPFQEKYIELNSDLDAENISNYVLYRSTNQGLHSTKSIAKIKIKSSISNLKLYIRSNAESLYDYIMLSNVNSNIPTGYSDTTNCKAHTRGNQHSGTSLSDYTEVSYGSVSAQSIIYVVYIKDGSNSSGTDTGYLLVSNSINNSIEVSPVWESSPYSFTRGSTTIVAGNNFRVFSDGTTILNNACMSGTVNSSAGYIGPLKVSSEEVKVSQNNTDYLRIKLSDIGDWESANHPGIETQYLHMFGSGSISFDKQYYSKTVDNVTTNYQGELSLNKDGLNVKWGPTYISDPFFAIHYDLMDLANIATITGFRTGRNGSNVLVMVYREEEITEDHWLDFTPDDVGLDELCAVYATRYWSSKPTLSGYQDYGPHHPLVYCYYNNGVKCFSVGNERGTCKFGIWLVGCRHGSNYHVE